MHQEEELIQEKTDPKTEHLLPKPHLDKKNLNLSIVDSNQNQNVKAAYAHILGDLLQSIGVVIGALVIVIFPKLEIIDPLLSLLFTIISFAVSIPVTKSIFKLLTDQTPKELQIEKFRVDL